MKLEVVAPDGIHRIARRREPVRVGLPLARGECYDAARATLWDAHGRPQLVATRPLDLWGDGSIRWLLTDFLAEHDGSERPATYELRADRDPVPVQSPLTFAVTVGGGGIVVDTGAARFQFGRGARFPFESVTVGDVQVIDPDRTRFTLEDAQGQACAIAIDRLEVEESNAVRAVIHAAGRLGGPNPPLALLFARFTFTAGSASVMCAVTIRNPRAARHPGGLWELGDPGSVFVRDASFVVALASSDDRADVHSSTDVGAPLDLCAGDLELYQDSSGGDNWRSSTHVDREGAVPLRFRGYRLRAGTGETTGLRATPVATLTRGSRRLAVAMPQFWQNFPKALDASGNGLTLRLFPHQHAGLHELQGGEQKTHVFFVAFDRDMVTDVPLDWARAPLLARTTPEEYARSGAVRHLVPLADDLNTDYTGLVSAAIEGGDTFFRKREAIDQYGWRHFGDLYADHEAVFHKGPMPLVSHYNNQYDAIAGFACQFMRSGDTRWWTLFTDLAAHVADIDLYHTVEDKAAYNHGLFWHTFHYVDAGRSSHRSYPRAKGVGGGGPSPEHNYSGGLLLHYFLTGNPMSREAVIDLAVWVIDMDDGRKTPLRFLVGGPSGAPSATASPGYHGPGRGPGNSINVLLDGYRLTGDSRFLRKADELIRRCIHPLDDIDARELLDAERRWSYTVFLHALGRYLDDKAERNDIETAYAYARESLLAYARWMADRERPYLDHPQELEYPTETWAAQELWKSEVFMFAAKHAAAAERARLLERSDFFFRYAISTLKGMDTRTLARPVVLLLSHGYSRAYAQRHPDRLRAPAAAGPHVFGQPQTFVPQRVRAKQRLIILTISAALAGIALVAAYLML